MAKRLNSIFGHKRSKSQGGEVDDDTLDFLESRNLTSPPQSMAFKPLDPVRPPPYVPSAHDTDFSDSDLERLGEDEWGANGAKKKNKKGDIRAMVRSVVKNTYEPKIASLQNELNETKANLGLLKTVQSEFDYDSNKDRLVAPPETLSTIDAGKGVDRNAKVKHLFNHIPKFDPVTSSIREWLLNFNSAVNNADYLLTEGELKQVIITRLDDKTQAMLSPWERNKTQLYNDLINHFDKSETPEQAQTKLCTLKPDKRLHNLFEFFYEAKRLLRLCPSEDPRLFTMALYNFVPSDIAEEMKERIKKYKALSGEKYPDINEIIRFVVRHRDKIDDFIEDQVKASKRVIRNVQVEKPTQAEPKPKCIHCNRKGHSSEDCFTIRICSRCGKKGHNSEVCRGRGCLKCGNFSHLVDNCDIYPHEQPSDSYCEYCKKLNGLILYHNESVCIVKPLMLSRPKN